MKKKVAQIIADFMVAKGVSHIFTVTGGGAMHLNDAFGHHPELNCIYNHHEQACSIAAEGYARFSGKIACVCVTSGPGGTNAITGVLGGWQDSVPMFVVSGQVKRITTTEYMDVPLRQLGDQEFQITDSVANMTKYAVMLTNAEDVLYHLEKAWFLANHGRKGPVWLDIPLDIQAAEVEEDTLCHFDEREYYKYIEMFGENASFGTGKDMKEPVADVAADFWKGTVQAKNAKLQQVLSADSPEWKDEYAVQVMEALKKAKRPVILAGTGIRLADAREELLEFIDALKIPVVTAWNAHDLLWERHPYDCGRPGTVGTRGGNFVIQSADLVIILACRMNIRMISYQWEHFAKNAVKIWVEIDKNELCKPTIKPEIPVHADIKEFLVNINNLIKKKNFTCESMQADWLSWCKDVQKQYPAVKKEFYESDMLNPYVFIKELTQRLHEDTAVVCGNGSACVITFQAAEIKKGQRYFTNSGCAAMGYGFPAAIGVAVQGGMKNTVCIDGDGSFQMNMQELQTVVQNELPIKIIILNNNGYHSIRQTQTNLFKGRELVGVSRSNGISFPDLEKLSYAYGIPYVRIASVDDCGSKLEDALTANGPIVIEAVVDEKQNFEPKLSSKVLSDGTMVSPPIDDMYPFLEREEYDAVKAIVR
ncbi:MAG: thiamine pyrophosphate-binding protein [Lachnospiraceae bacterium]|nr:thiamine pyrophosphate-binding protein [Lachnospiraceae bacterium]